MVIKAIITNDFINFINDFIHLNAMNFNVMNFNVINSIKVIKHFIFSVEITLKPNFKPLLSIPNYLFHHYLNSK